MDTHDTPDEERPLVTSIRLTPRERQKLRTLAAHEKRSMSQQLRYMIERDAAAIEEAAA